ncbi:Histone deacetylase HDT1 [Cucurbita argyrosperma subsp. argyrosperma]|nr:Histone deacetylase HDT1 [Cucurbita argyrosperma subsp. argyrosperma]
MEFWGVEVKPGQALSVQPGDQKYLHLSQATLGELKKDKANESVTIFVKIGDQKLVLGILSAEKFPQLSFDLVFEKEFELSHNGKSGNSDFGSEDEELTLQPVQNGKPSQEEKSIAGKNSKKAEVKSLVPSKEEGDDDSEDDDDSDEDEDSDDDSDEEMLGADSDSDDEDDGTESEEETPKKVESAKKRPNESASKTPVSKKAKVASAEKTGSKKGGHTDTPHPAKKPVKTPSKAETPKSAGQVSCKSCDRSFGSDSALQSHSKAKHGGVEVKSGKPLVVKPGIQKYLHLSQATLGEIKKDKANENVTIFLKIGDQKLVLGILSAEKFPQLSFDLVFEKEFELSHNGKSGSVYYSDSGSEDEELALPPAQNGKPSQKEKSISDKSNGAKAASLKKPNVRPLEPSKDEDDESDDDDESDEDEDSDDESDEEMLNADSGDSDDEDDDSDSDEETPKKIEPTKKRPNESATKTTPLPAKKAKLASPGKTDPKKGGHTATPHPAKKTGKTPAAKLESPKSGGQFSCKSCDRAFGSDGALQSHSKAKHGGK